MGWGGLQSHIVAGQSVLCNGNRNKFTESSTNIHSANGPLIICCSGAATLNKVWPNGAPREMYERTMLRSSSLLLVCNYCLCLTPTSTWLPPGNVVRAAKRGRAPTLVQADSSRVRAGSMEEATLLTGKVPYGEDSRKYRRTTYTHRDWFKHRSTDRLFGNLASTVSSGVVRNLLTEVSAVAAVATALVAWNCVLADGWTDLGGVVHEPLLGTWVCLSLPALPFTLSASSLGLLLVFRTNPSYARWLEARVTWGRIVAHSRGIIRQASVWNTADAGARGGELRQLCHSVYAFPRCLCAYLRGAEDEPLLVTELRRRNCPALEELIDSPADARPVLALHQLTQTMHAQAREHRESAEISRDGAGRSRQLRLTA